MGGFRVQGRGGGFRAFVVAVEFAGEGFVGQTGSLAGLGVGKTPAFAIEDEFAVVDEGHAVGGGKGFGSGTDEIDVGTLFEDQARGMDGIAEVFDTRDPAGFHPASVHE